MKLKKCDAKNCKRLTQINNKYCFECNKALRENKPHKKESYSDTLYLIKKGKQRELI